MEGFLSTLPPYVHHYLDRHSPVDVFNVLRELICFAVLYYDDRNRLKQATQDCLHKRNQRQLPTLRDEYKYYESESEAEVPDLDLTDEDIRETQELEDFKSISSYRTFPEWSIHDEPEEPRPKGKGSLKNLTSEWTTCKRSNSILRRMDRAKSQIIPDLRSYLEEGHTRMTTSSTPSVLSSNKSNKRHSMFNIKTSPSSTQSIASGSPRLNTAAANKLISVSPVLEANSIKTLSRSQSVVRDNTTRTRTAPRLTVSSSTGTAVTPTRSLSIQLKQPKMNTATRIRAEHARLQQEELERKKNTPPPGSVISQRIRQRASSGIDWDTIKKQERRRTLTESTFATNTTFPNDEENEIF